MKMLKCFFMSLFIIMLIGITGCSSPDATTTVSQSQDETKALVNEVKSMGFDTSNYFISNGQLVVEGDIGFDINELKKQVSQETVKSSGPMKQYAHIYTVSSTGVSNILIYASSLRTDWLGALDRAIADWNNSQSAIRMTRVTSGSAHITVSGTNAGRSYVCQATFPYSDNDLPGNQILVNYYTDILSPALSDSNKENTMVHELGHCIGMRHMNVSESNRYIIPGSPTTDNTSVMITDCYKTWAGFSYYDQYAIWYLYGASGPYIIIYEHSNYCGKRMIVRGNLSSLSPYGFNDNISSIKLFNGARVLLCKDNDYKGSCYPIISSTDYLSQCNDVISSILVY